MGNMKRRSFIAFASVAPIGLAYSAEDQGGREERLALAREGWSEHTSAVKSGVFVSSEGNLRLEVSLIDDDDAVSEETIKVDGEEEQVFTFEGMKLPRWHRPQDGIIKRFQFFWDEKEIPVEKRFWNDFGGCRMEKTKLTIDKIPRDEQYEFSDFLEELEGPKVILSANGGTALIEWSIIDMDACCGHRATMRWIISKSGAVMRHRHTTPNPC